ncbi:MAG: hypothetical protein ABIR91_01305 [Candidatus Saccharimonadales bacterium]
MSLEFSTKRIYKTDGTTEEGVASPRAVFDYTNGTQMVMNHGAEPSGHRYITPKNSGLFWKPEHARSDNLFVSNTSATSNGSADWAIDADIYGNEGIETIHYLIKEFRGSNGSEALLLPLELALNDPDKYVSLDLAIRLLSLPERAIAQHAIGATLLIPYLRYTYGLDDDLSPSDDRLQLPR